MNRTELDDWILAVSLDEHEKVVGAVERVMADSGAAVSACPSRHAPEIPMSNHSRRSVLGTAPGAQIQRAGQKTIEYENGDGGSVNINFKVADVITPLVAVGELQRCGITVVMGPHRSFVTRSQVTRPPGRNPNFEHCNGAYWMSLTRWENGTKTVAPVDLGDPAPTSKSLNELPSVEDTIDVAREDAEANVLTVLTTPKECGAVERSGHELTHVPHRNLGSRCVAGRGTDDSHRQSDSHSGSPRVGCDFMHLLCPVQLASPGWIIFGTIEVESQSMAAAVTAKAASDILVRLFLAMLDAWGRSDAKMLLRSGQEVTLSLILR